MITVKEVEIRLDGHEKECAVRYANIEKQLNHGSTQLEKLSDKLDERLGRFDKRLWLLYPAIILSPFIDKVII